MAGRKAGWTDTSVGKKAARRSASDDVDLDLDLGDDDEEVTEEESEEDVDDILADLDLDEPAPKPKKAAKKTRKKSAPKPPQDDDLGLDDDEPEESPEDDDLDLDALLADDEPAPKPAKKATKKKTSKKAASKPAKPQTEEDDDLGLDLDEPAPKPAKKATKKKTSKKTGKKGATKADLEEALDDLDEKAAAKPKGKTAEVASRLGIDLSAECPVCRSTKDCDCTEDDRAFQRRTRFAEDVKETPRCNCCQAPLSVLYLPRPGSGGPPYDLTQFAASYGCVPCAGDALASIALAVHSRVKADEQPPF